MTDLIKYAGNNKKNNSYGTAGRIGYVLPNGNGNIVSGEEYKIASVPANAIITSVNLVVETAFNGTTPKGTVKVGGTAVLTDKVLDKGVDSYTTAVAVEALTDVTFTPTLVGASTGEAVVVVEFIELNGYEGTFTE